MPRKGYPEMLTVVEVLDLRDHLALLDPSASKLGFCDRGVEFASLIHVSAHSGGAFSSPSRKAKPWLREARKRLEMWQVVRDRTRPQATETPPNGPLSPVRP